MGFLLIEIPPKRWLNWVKNDACIDGMTYMRVGPALEDTLDPVFRSESNI